MKMEDETILANAIAAGVAEALKNIRPKNDNINIPSIHPFSSNEGVFATPWDEWILSFDIYLKAAGLDMADSQRKLNILLHNLGSFAQQKFRLLPKPTEAELEKHHIARDDQYSVALYQLQTEYTRKVSLVLLGIEFRRRRQHPGEKIGDFVTALRQLATRCDYGELEDRLLAEQFTLGIQCDRIRERLISESLSGNDITFQRVYTIAEQLYAAHQESQMVVDNENPQIHAILQGRRQTSLAPPRRANNCSRCGTMHEPRQCPAYNKQCHQCGILGHFAAVCRRRLPPPSAGGVGEGLRCRPTETRLRH